MAQILSRNLILLLLYWGFGVFTELLAMPPDYATPVWPSAGVALGFLLVYGPTVVPGLFLGAVAANLNTAYDQAQAPDLLDLAFVLSVSIGAVLQGLLGRWLLLRYRLLPQQLTSAGSILRFLLIIGPVCSLVNSVNSSVMLAALGIVPWEFWFNNWMVWWVGDSVGALVMTPLVVHLLTWRRLGRSQPWQSALLPVVFLVLVLATFFFVRGLEQENRKTLIADIGQQFLALLALNVNEVRTVSGAVTSFFMASEFVSMGEFNTFCRPLIAQSPSIRVIQYLPQVAHAERAEFVASMRQQGMADFHIRELDLDERMVVSRDRDRYLPITYLYPLEGNRTVQGLDVLALDYRGDIRAALASGEPKTSTPLKLMQAPESGLAYIYARPFETNQGQQAVTQVLFQIDVLLRRSVTVPGLLAALQLVDITDPDTPIPLHRGASVISDAQWQTEFKLLDRTLRASLSPTYEMVMRVSSWQSYALLIGGLLYVAILEAVLLAMLSRQRRVEQEVALKTRELAQAKEVAERASMAKTEFLASMSHELRTPLNSVIGFTHRVLRRAGDRLDQRSYEALTIVERNGNHLLGLINNLLDISKLDLGQLQLRMAEVAPDQILVETKEQFLPLASAKNTRLRLDCRFRGSIEADPVRLRQVIINLLSNAIKFTSDGDITIRLEEQQRDGMAGINLTVEDTGVGIASADLEKLFVKFQKVGQVEKLNPEGTGLGLALVKELVAAHGGVVSVNSHPGKLTVFSVWLPLRQPVHPAQ